MGRPLSTSQIDKLGDRLRRTLEPTEEDLRSLEEVRLAYDPALQEVVSRLKGMGLAPRSRLKTTGTILDKLRRRPTRLSTIQDIGGVRVVWPWTLDEQDAVVERIRETFDKTRVDDLRVTPSQGYRAVHVIVEVDGCPIEIQVRTMLQDAWANAMEKVGDKLGREVRYLGPEAPGLGGWGKTVVGAMMAISNGLVKLERAGHDVQQMELVSERPDAPADFRGKVEELRRLRSEAEEGVLSIFRRLAESVARGSGET